MDPAKIGLIDNRNKSLWENLTQSCLIEVELADIPNYYCESENNKSTILISKRYIDIHSFTHELLHILLRQKDIYIGSNLKLLVYCHKRLMKIFSDELLEHFGNCMDHIKMLPIYLEMGFDVKRFISDYDVNKCTPMDLLQLEANYRRNDNYYSQAVDFYIGKFISIKADPNNFFNYNNALGKLRRIDPNIFEILDQYVSKWEAMSLEKENIWDDDYITLNNELIDKLNAWIYNKKII